MPATPLGFGARGPAFGDSGFRVQGSVFSVWGRATAASPASRGALAAGQIKTEYEEQEIADHRAACHSVLSI